MSLPIIMRSRRVVVMMPTTTYLPQQPGLWLTTRPITTVTLSPSPTDNPRGSPPSPLLLRQHNRHRRSLSSSSSSSNKVAAGNEDEESSPLQSGAASEGEAGGSAAASGSGGSSKMRLGWDLFPEDIVEHLSRFVVGQEEAKKATAIALRSRWRRMQLEDGKWRQEVLPANILMKGPTGSGKTEIARRLASLAKAPFCKVEATRYTEVGIVGENTSDMIKSLMEEAVAMARKEAKEIVEAQARKKAEAKVLELLKMPKTEGNRYMLRRGELDHHTVKLDPNTTGGGRGHRGDNLRDLFSGDGPPDFSSLLNNGMKGGIISITMGGRGGGRGGQGGDKQTLSAKAALERLTDDLASDMTDEQEIIHRAREMTEQCGIVFLDEIDKLCVKGRDEGSRMATDSKAEGVQRELLTLVEGCQVKTSYGTVRTDHILFIASGAFHSSSPSDLLPELQGRFPVRVELKPLTRAELMRILSGKDYNLVEQTVKLLATEGVHLSFTPCAVAAIAAFAEQINRCSQDIGARRLNTVMHRVMEDLSFSAPRLRGQRVVIDGAFVEGRLKDFDPAKNQDVTRYIL